MRGSSAITDTLDCGGGFTATLKSGALQPVEPGDYRVSFGVIEILPVECTEGATPGEYTCDPPADPDLNLGGGWYPVEITLPASGDVSSMLDVP